MMNRRNTRETEILRKARQKMGFSQQQVATLAGVHIRQYQRIEYGERSMGSINMRFGLAVCAILEINPFDLVSFTADGWEIIPQASHRMKSIPRVNLLITTGQTLLGLKMYGYIACTADLMSYQARNP